MRHVHLDRIVSLERGVSAIGVRAVSLSDDVFTDHFPGNPVLPGVYVLEGLAQTAGMLLWETSDHSRVGVMVSIDRARFSSFARPGEIVQLAVQMDSYDGRAARVSGVASVAERQVAMAGFTFTLQHPGSVFPPLYLPFWEQAAETFLGRYPGLADSDARKA